MKGDPGSDGELGIPGDKGDQAAPGLKGDPGDRGMSVSVMYINSAGNNSVIYQIILYVGSYYLGFYSV